MTQEHKKPILEVEDVTKTFRISSGQLSRPKREIKALDRVSFTVAAGETLGVVGESGCGKSTLGKVIMRLLEADSGSVRFDGMEVLRAGKKQLRKIRENMQIIFQDPYASLNPRMTMEHIIGEPLQIAGRTQHMNERIIELTEQVGLSRRDLSRFPGEFSGGQRQRICIARAIALNPRLVICDEPVSALDVSVQSQILKLFNELKPELGLTYIFISHDLSVVRHVSDRICVMYLGSIVESGTTEEVYCNPAHPYTKCLLSAVLKPRPHSRKSEGPRLFSEISRTDAETEGCPFQSRCAEAIHICGCSRPADTEISDGHTVKCHLYRKQ